jgi:hypothetical protein
MQVRAEQRAAALAVGNAVNDDDDDRPAPPPSSSSSALASGKHWGSKGKASARGTAGQPRPYHHDEEQGRRLSGARSPPRLPTPKHAMPSATKKATTAPSPYHYHGHQQPPFRAKHPAATASQPPLFS